MLPDAINAIYKYSSLLISTKSTFKSTCTVPSQLPLRFLCGTISLPREHEVESVVRHHKRIPFVYNKIEFYPYLALQLSTSQAIFQSIFLPTCVRYCE